MFRAPHFIKICRQAKCKNGLLKMKHMGKRCKMDDNEFDPSARKVPSNNFERALGFASLAAKVAFNGLAEGVKKGISGEEINFKKAFISKSNAEILTDALCRLRGAALKVGQMISLQEEYLPKEIAQVLAKVRDKANIMPKKQLLETLKNELGENWEDHFGEFDLTPFAAASIGQVHKAKLKSGETVAVKIQYPGISKSFESDLNNLKWIVQKFDIFPKGLYMDNVIDAARIELAREVDYELEARQQLEMKELLKGYEKVNVPKVFKEVSTKHVLAVEFVEGKPVNKVSDISQDERNSIAFRLLDITLLELFQYRFMQTDPNWSNFLYDTKTKTLHLIDFGAARKYSKKFTDEYIQLVNACVIKNDELIFKHSSKLGFTTGDETHRLKKLQAKSGYVLGEPFRKEFYDFSNDRMVSDLKAYGTEILSDRLTPPPTEAYTLHRKLSGCYLTCFKLKAIVRCKQIFETRLKNYDWKNVIKDSVIN